MSVETAQLMAAALIVLAAAYIPGYFAVRISGGSRVLGLGLAPAIGAAIAALAAMGASVAGISWSLLPFGLASVLLCAIMALLRVCGVRLPHTELVARDIHVHGSESAGQTLRRIAPARLLAWVLAFAGALAAAIGPIVYAAKRADAVLERYDTLYHLTAIQHIVTTGDGSSLSLNSIARTTGAATIYPAAFHDLASLVPHIPAPIVLNGATLALSVVPWALGIALLARELYPGISWAPPVASLVGILIPATPLDLWIHLSPIPNLVGFAALPGMLAGAVALWRTLMLEQYLGAGSGHEQYAHAAPMSSGSAAHKDPVHGGGSKRLDSRSRKGFLGHVVAALLVICLCGVGLTLLQPNVAVTALIFLAVLSTVTGFNYWRRRPALALIPIAFLAPIGLLVFTPLGSRVTGFSGGLQVSLVQALGEISFGLLTVWPMALGVCFAVLWWPGLVSSLFSRMHWLAAAWLVFAVLYLDAAIDSPLGLSVLYFRGQDRVAIPLAMICALLVVPGLQAWHSKLSNLAPLAAFFTSKRPLAVCVLGTVAVCCVGLSIPDRFDNAQLNLRAEYPGRGRFIQVEERAKFANIADELDPQLTILASPYSGAAHMYGIYNIPSYFPVAGVSLTKQDLALISAVESAANSPEDCQLLHDAGIGYVYQERRLYQYDSRFTPLEFGGAELGTVLFSTSHSRLIRVECAGTTTVP